MRSAFNLLFKNGQIGKIDGKDKEPSLSARLRRVHDEWKSLSDQELEEFVLGIQAIASSDEIIPVMARTEGGKKVYVSVRRERDPRLRADAIRVHGRDCMACGFNFEKFYGDIGKDFIEVHHVVPLSKSGRTKTSPKTDLIVLCANCHRIVHKQRDICLSLNELKSHIGRQ
ncbi:MAG: HNH endonuclease [Chloroflexota bacterium]|nr:HNH endonuclease [Chloroflexota bacterium]